ncbi:hypothetical protein BGZ61DRAFT_456702 [Ilyonectria robusta]|uniref:uncharacterized protein n=1 Tax=Ilyonectria robusta TaxID=1079257 RepID=UPI001E8DE148|nr:uncharacterized protein BGZ61DRAFT_456702 [Ilyonectria robusta]KAH8680443.1 hypothetical protein BGZ61DRAFT_456702 [Ilyonectria robusta]
MLATARKQLSSARMQATGPSRKDKKRVRKFTSDDRAAHRIFEKNRREAFKEKLNELAGQIPGLAECDPQRLSKHVVVEESITRCQTLHRRCLDALGDIRALIQERDELLLEVNSRRQLERRPLRSPQAVALHLDGLVELEKEAKLLAKPATSQQPESRQAVSCSPDEEGTDRQDHSHDDEAIVTEDTTQDLATGSIISVPIPSIASPLLVPEPSGESMTVGLSWNLVNNNHIPEPYLNPSPSGSLRPTQDASGIGAYAHPGTFSISFPESLDFLNAENSLPCQDFTFYDAEAMAFHLEPGMSDAQATAPPGYLPDSETLQLGAGIR